MMQSIRTSAALGRGPPSFRSGPDFPWPAGSRGVRCKIRERPGAVVGDLFELVAVELERDLPLGVENRVLVNRRDRELEDGTVESVDSQETIQRERVRLVPKREDDGSRKPKTHPNSPTTTPGATPATRMSAMSTPITALSSKPTWIAPPSDPFEGSEKYIETAIFR